MNLFQTIILSIVQGLAEFLPISSSGHLNLAQHFFNLKPSLTFDIFLNTATFISVLFFFRNKISYFLKNLKYIIVGSIPAALAGILLKHQFEAIFADIKLLPFFFLITSAFVFSTKFIDKKTKTPAKLNFKNSLIIGLFQAVAILPAVSRAGSTIFAGLLTGLSAQEAFNFSFCLFIPASFGALVLDAKDLSATGLFNMQYVLAFVITTLVGIFALGILKKVLVGKKLWMFGIYTFILAIILFFIL